MSLHKKIENISNLEPFKRYQYFIRKIADFLEIWTIVNKNNDYALSEIDDKTIISFWPEECFIKSNLSSGWRKSKPLKLSLDDFEEKVIDLIEENNYLLNIFPVNGKSGFIVDINEFMRDLTEELKQYE